MKKIILFIILFFCSCNILKVLNLYSKYNSNYENLAKSKQPKGKLQVIFTKNHKDFRLPILSLISKQPKMVSIHENITSFFVEEDNPETISLNLESQSLNDIYLPTGFYYAEIYNEIPHTWNFGRGRGFRTVSSDNMYGLFFITPQVDTFIGVNFGYELHNEKINYNFQNIENNCKTRDMKRNFVASINGQREYSMHTCSKIEIKENQTTIVNIIIKEPKIIWSSSFFQWVPGLIFMAPIIGGISIFKSDIEVSLINPK